jgi:preprotein translocase subunit SecG
MIITLLVLVHVIVSLFLILVVLLQQGKSADWAGTFGGGSSQVAFGARTGATLLTKATTAAAVIFMVTSLSLTILIGRTTSGSVLPADATAPVTTPAPATTPAPEAPPPAPAAPATPGSPAEPPK